MTNEPLNLQDGCITLRPTQIGLMLTSDGEYEGACALLTLEETMKLKRYLEDVLYAT